MIAWSQNNERFILRDLHHLCFLHNSLNSVKFANNQFNARRSYIPWILLRTLDYENCPKIKKYPRCLLISMKSFGPVFFFLEAGLCMCRWTKELKIYSRISEIILKKKKEKEKVHQSRVPLLSFIFTVPVASYILVRCKRVYFRSFFRYFNIWNITCF